MYFSFFKKKCYFHTQEELHSTCLQHNSVDSKHALCAKIADVPLSHHTDGVKANVLHFTHSSEPFAKENHIKIAIWTFAVQIDEQHGPRDGGHIVYGILEAARTLLV